MANKILISSIFDMPVFESEARKQGLQTLSQLGEFVPEPPELTAEHSEGVVASIAGGSRYTEGFYRAAKDLRIVARWGVGYDQVNVDVATEHGVIITITPVHMETVAEYTIAQWLTTLKRTYTLNRNSHAGDFSLQRTYEAQGSTLGLYGCGRIGQEVAKRARPLLGPHGRLLIYDVRSDISEIAAQYDATVVDSPQILFQESDTVSLHVSGDDTIVNYELLCAMKPHASLINPSRGSLVNDRDVNRAIAEERLYYYVVDDPVNGTREIHKDHPRIICTNHNGGIAVESVIRLDQTTFSQVTDTLQGRRPDHILNPQVLDHPKVKGFLEG